MTVDDELARTGRTRALVGGVAAACVFGVALLLVQIRWGPLAWADTVVLDGLHRVALHASLFVVTMKAVSALGTWPVYGGLLTAAVVVLLRRGCRREAAFAVATVVGGGALNSAVKAVVGRARPVVLDPVAHAGHASFPSGHANGVAVACGVLLVLLSPATRRRWRAAAWGWATLVGFSRLALGVHFLSDVLAGWALGLAWVIGSTVAWGVVWADRGRSAPSVPASSRSASSQV